jgi:hemoglobin
LKFDDKQATVAVAGLKKGQFYANVLADPLLQPLFGEGQAKHVEHLTWFTAESFGGPDRFSEELGFRHLIDVHRGLHITEEQRQRFVDLYADALDAAGLPTDEEFRTAVLEHVEFGTRVARQNSNATTRRSCTRCVRSRAGPGRATTKPWVERYVPDAIPTTGLFNGMPPAEPPNPASP